MVVSQRYKKLFTFYIRQIFYRAWDSKVKRKGGEGSCEITFTGYSIYIRLHGGSLPNVNQMMSANNGSEGQPSYLPGKHFEIMEILFKIMNILFVIGNILFLNYEHFVQNYEHYVRN